MLFIKEFGSRYYHKCSRKIMKIGKKYEKFLKMMKLNLLPALRTIFRNSGSLTATDTAHTQKSFRAFPLN